MEHLFCAKYYPTHFSCVTNLSLMREVLQIHSILPERPDVFQKSLDLKRHMVHLSCVRKYPQGTVLHN